MDDYWANLDMFLDIDPAGPRVGRALEDALRAAVRDGRLPPGTRLPATRALAADLRLARNTVAGVYGQLTAEGWLTARSGAGTWVASGVDLRPPASGADPRPSASGASPRPPVAGVDPHPPASGVDQRPPAAPAPAVRPPRYDLHPGVPDLAAFPRREWLAAARKALAEAPGQVLAYPDPRGLGQARAAVAGYLARVRGVHIFPERIFLTAGFTHGLALLAAALRGRGCDAIAVEPYVLPEHRRVLAGAGLRLIPLPADAGGAVPDPARLAGAGAAAGARAAVGAALLTPAHQFPLGMVLAPGRRRRFVEWAADTGAVLIEDDYDGEFRYDRHPVGAAQALAPEHVVYGGTASKALAPGLRLGWLAVPARLLDDMMAAAGHLRGGPDVIAQLTLAEFLASGAYDRRVRLARLAYRRRRDELIAALAARVPAARVTGIAAGLSAVVELPPGMTEEEAIAAAARRGVAVHGLSWYAVDPGSVDPGSVDAGTVNAGTAGTGTAGTNSPGTNLLGPGGTAACSRPPSLVVGYGCPPRHAFTTAIARLCAALSP